MKIRVMVLIGLVLAACGGSAGPLTQGLPAPSIAGTQSAAAVATTRLSFTNENWALAVTDANSYKGSPVTLLGKIFLEPQRTADQLAFQMYADPANQGQNTIVGGLPTTADFKKGDYVKVVGVVFDVLEGTNALNATLRVPRIRADTVTHVTRAEVVAPTVKAVDVNKPQKQFGVTITLLRVEFAKTETRLYVRVENAGPSKANAYSFYATVVQGTKQLKTKTVFDSGYPDLPSGMLPGVTAETVLLFDALDIAPLRFVWTASSDDYTQRFQDFNWTVTP